MGTGPDKQSKKSILYWSPSSELAAFWYDYLAQLGEGKLDLEPVSESTSAGSNSILYVDTQAKEHQGLAALMAVLEDLNQHPFLYRSYRLGSWTKSLFHSLFRFFIRQPKLGLKLSHAFWGSNPKSLKPFWMIYLGLVLYLLYLWL